MLVGGRNNGLRIVSEFYQMVARIHCSKVSCSYHIYRWPNGRALDDVRCYFLQCRNLTATHRAVRMFSEKFCQPVVYVCGYVELGYLVQKGGVSYRIKRFTEQGR